MFGDKFVSGLLNSIEREVDSQEICSWIQLLVGLSTLIEILKLSKRGIRKISNDSGRGMKSDGKYGRRDGTTVLTIVKCLSALFPPRRNQVGLDLF